MNANFTTPNLNIASCSLVCGTGMTGSGALAYGRGVRSITKTDTGDLAVELDEVSVRRVLFAYASVRMATPALGRIVPVSVSGNTVNFTNLNASAAAADVASGDVIDFLIAYDRSGLADKNSIALATA